MPDTYRLQSNTPDEALQWARGEDATVDRMLSSDALASHAVIIAQLVSDKKFLIKEIMRLHSICPRKVALPDGTVMVWHCPDNMVPNIKTTSN